MQTVLLMAIAVMILAACSQPESPLPTAMALATAPPSMTPLSPTSTATDTPTLEPTATEPSLISVTLTRQAIDALQTQIAHPTATPTLTPAELTAEAALPVEIVTPETEPIALNQPVIVNLTEAGPVDLIYNAYGGETVNIVARSLQTPGALDPMLQLLDWNGNVMFTNDDNRSGRSNLYKLDAALDDIVLDSPGEYIIRVSSVYNVGAVEVRVEGSPPPTPLPELLEGDLTYPDGELPPDQTSDLPQGITQVLQGQLINGQPYQYTFAANEGESVTIIVRATSDTLDPVVTLYTPDDMILDQNDQHMSDYPGLGVNDAVIDRAYIPFSGNYLIEVTDFIGDASGTFELTLIRQ